jgi:two-component system chemotaxis response regulator CheB
MKAVLIITDIGGPVALHNLLSEMPAAFSAPIVVLQSTEMGILESSAAALRRTVSLKVAILDKKTDKKMSLQPGCVYFGAPMTSYSVVADESQLTVESTKSGPKDECIKKTIESFAEAYRTELVVVFLSGRGREKEIIACCGLLEDAGSKLIVLDRLEAVVFDMGKSVLKASSHAEELPAEEIAAFLTVRSSGQIAARAPQRKH